LVLPVAFAAESSPAILNSWKEIAAYLDRGVRTVQRWEAQLRLPVHRIGTGKRSPVYAVVSELKFWLATAGIDTHNGKAPRTDPVPRDYAGKSSSALQLSHELIKRSRELVRTVAANSVRHQRQAEVLQKHILRMRSRMP
jgi:hypothetical protein